MLYICTSILLKEEVFVLPYLSDSSSSLYTSGSVEINHGNLVKLTIQQFYNIE